MEKKDDITLGQFNGDVTFLQQSSDVVYTINNEEITATLAAALTGAPDGAKIHFAVVDGVHARFTVEHHFFMHPSE